MFVLFSHLCKGVIDEWRKCSDEEAAAEKKPDTLSKHELLGLVREVALYNLRHNAEVEACDLLVEIEQLALLLEDAFVAEMDFARVCLYLLRFALSHIFLK